MEMERIASQMTKLESGSPPSPAAKATRDRILLSFEVIGGTQTRPLRA
jgi:hypothetical protein